MKPLRWHVSQAPVCKYPHYCYYNIRGGVSLMAWVSHWASHSLGIPAISASSLSMHIYKQEKKSLWVSCCLHQKICLITRGDWFMFHRSYCKKSQLGSLTLIDSREFPLSQLSSSSQRFSTVTDSTSLCLQPPHMQSLWLLSRFSLSHISLHPSIPDVFLISVLSKIQASSAGSSFLVSLGLWIAWLSCTIWLIYTYESMPHLSFFGLSFAYKFHDIIVFNS